MNKLYWLDQIQPSDRALVGDKAFYLGQLAQTGYPVMPGFAVSAQVLQEFLEGINWIEPLFADLPNSSLHLDVDNPRQLQAIAQQIRQSITTANLLPAWVSYLGASTQSLSASTVILRPSIHCQSRPGLTSHLVATGLLESQICSNEATAIAQALKRVWAELFRAKSLLYWRYSGIHLQQINLAVLIQPIDSALASGSLQANGTSFEIQSTWGLGIGLVRGEVTPDFYQVEAQTGTVQVQQPGSKLYAYNLETNRQPFPGQSQPLEQLKDSSGLQVYLLSENQQQYALSAMQLSELIQLAQQTAAGFSHVFTLEWILCRDHINSEPRLYLTQIYPNELSGADNQQSGLHPLPEAALAHSHVQAGPTAPVLRGLAAASGRAIAPAYVVKSNETLPQILPGAILVAPVITPDWLPVLKQVAGIIAEQGGMTSHGAIVARELGIPAVIGVGQATHLLQTGEYLSIDGSRGEVYRIEHQELNSGGQAMKEVALGSSFQSSSLPSHSQAESLALAPLTATRLLVNLSQVSLIDRVQQLPVDGVGLLRSELMMLEVLEHEHLHLWQQKGRQAELIERIAQCIDRFSRAFAPRPVFYRSLDLRSHEFQMLAGNTTAVATNPMLGIRGTFSYVLDPTLFQLELAALAQVQAAGTTNIHLLLPFVRTVEEFSFCRQQVEQAGLMKQAQFQLWMMAEVPSVLFLLPDYVAAGAQGISIGMNDLTQLLLGVDRDQSQMATAFDQRHPAVLQAIAQLIRMAKQAGIPCCICGQAPISDPELIDSLIRWGVTSISVDPDGVEPTYRAIVRAEQRLLLEVARAQLG